MHQESALELHPAAVAGDGTASWWFPSAKQFGSPRQHTFAYAHSSFLFCIGSVVSTCGLPPLHCLCDRNPQGNEPLFSWCSAQKYSPGLPSLHPTPCSCQPVLRLRNHGKVYAAEADPSPEIWNVDISSAFFVLQVSTHCVSLRTNISIA